MPEIISRKEAHIFEIDDLVWNALGYDEVDATVAAMKEFGIYRLPFEAGEIVLRLTSQRRLQGHRVICEVKGLREGEDFTEEVVLYPGSPASALEDYKRHMANFKWEHPPENNCVTEYLGARIEGKELAYRLREVPTTAENLEAQRSFYRDALIVLLASKGLDKISRKSGLAKLGIGKKTGEYITTLRLEKNLGSHENVRPGHPIRPHLRRGHAAMQHYGQGNQLVKRIWRDACFVNADANFVSERKAYRVIH